MTTHAVLYYTHFVSEMVKAELGKLRRELHSNFALFAMGCCHERTTLDDWQVQTFTLGHITGTTCGRYLTGDNWKMLIGRHFEEIRT